MSVASRQIILVMEKPEDEETAPDLTDVSWSPDGRYVYLTHSAKDKWERGLVRLNISTHEIEDLVKDENLYSRWMFSEDGQKIFYQFSDGDLPNDLYMSDARLERAVRLTDLNPWLAQRKLTRSELVEYLDVDGNTLYGILYYPVGYEKAQTYPLIVAVHGGPESHYVNGWHTRYSAPAQVLAGQGYLVFFPNYRSSTGYGIEVIKKTPPSTL